MAVASCKLLTSPCLLVLPLPGFYLCACFSATGTLYISPCLPAPLGSRELREGGLWLPLGGIRQVSGKVILAVDVWITELAVRDFYWAFFRVPADPSSGRKASHTPTQGNSIRNRPTRRAPSAPRPRAVSLRMTNWL